MNIYIPYSAARDIHKGLELKYALRSIEKNLIGWDEVYIIASEFPAFSYGFKPGQLRDIFYEDVSGLKETSIFRKMAQVPDDEFIMLHDDHYLLKPLDVSEIKQWHSHTLAKEVSKPQGGRYGKALRNTLEIFPDGLYFDIHTPIIFNRAKLASLTWDKEYCLKSLYCNSFPGESEFMEDLKIDNYVSKDFIKTLIKDRLFVSTGCMHDPMIEVLNELFPNKSKFEI